MIESLLKTSKHTIMTITRVDSENKLPEGAASKEVDYNKLKTPVEHSKAKMG
jgi:hypothetical protein